MCRAILTKLSVLLILLWVIIFTPCSFAAQGAGGNAQESFFYQGNIAYQEGKYDLAIKSYELLASAGWEGGNLYYNLGNSYFKKGELGKAILNYVRAKQFIPEDSDLKSNYAYALSILNLGPQSTGNNVQQAVDRLFAGITLNRLTILLSAIYILLIISFVLLLLFSGLRRFFRPFIFMFLVLFILAASALDSKIIYFFKGAVVISKEAEVKFEPLPSATTYFKLSEGNKVEVIEKTKNWYKIKRFDGKFGWVNKEAVSLIVRN